MSLLKSIFVSFLIVCFIGCNDKTKKSESTPTVAGVSTFYFIRHAEKDRSNMNENDPELNQDGLGRAMHWAEILKDVPLNAIYSTDYKRTTMTAAPISVKKDIDIQYYDPRIIDVNQFKLDNQNKNVLIVGHSNTTPDFVNMMIGEEKYQAMDDSDNGSLFIVQIANGVPTAQRLHFNCNCPKRD